MTTSPRTIAGLHCFDVLDILDDFVDHELDEGLLQRVHAHLEGCQACASFGARYSALIAHLRHDVSANLDPVSSPSPEALAALLLKRRNLMNE